MFDKDMREALAQDAAMLEAMGAGEQPLAFSDNTISMEMTNAKKDLWKVTDSGGKVYGKNLSLKRADDLFCKLTNPTT